MQKTPRQYYVYILANATNVATYIGVTSNLVHRVYEHREKVTPGFTARYDINKLVYYEIFGDPVSAIEREELSRALPSQKEPPRGFDEL